MTLADDKIDGKEPAGLDLRAQAREISEKIAAERAQSEANAARLMPRAREVTFEERKHVEAERIAQKAALYKALGAAQRAFEPLAKDRTVWVQPRKRADGSWPEKYSFEYATLGAVHAATRRALNDNGLCVTGTLVPTSGGWELRVILGHESGAELTSIAVFPRVGGGGGDEDGGRGNPWQDLGKALTYARRYIEQTMLGVAAEFDSDANDDDEVGGYQDKAPSRSQPTPPAKLQQSAAKPQSNGQRDAKPEKPKPTQPEKPVEKPPEPTRPPSTPPPLPDAAAALVVNDMKDVTALIPITAHTTERLKIIFFMVYQPRGNATGAEYARMLLESVRKDKNDLTEADGLAAINWLKVQLKLPESEFEAAYAKANKETADRRAAAEAKRRAEAGAA